MKTKHILKSFLIVSIAALTFVACGKKTTKTNKTTNKTTENKTQITTKSKTTKAKTTTEAKGKVLSANKFYLSNDEKMIIKAFADNNKVSDLLIYSTYGATAYIKPLIENNKFKALSIVDNSGYSIYNKDSFYLKGYTDFVPIMDVLVTSIYDGYVAVSKPLYVKMSDDLITVKFNDKTYSINLDGSINEKEFNEITSSFNPTSITTSLDNDILKVNSNGVTATLSNDICSTKAKYSSVDLKFNNGQIVKIVDADNPNYDRTVTLTLNNDLSVNTIKKELEFQTVLQTYTYSNDYKTITINETELYDDENGSIFAPKGKISAMPFDYLYTLEYDNYFRIASSKEKVSIEDFVFYESESIYTYNNSGYLATETSLQSGSSNNYKYVYDYNNDGYVTKIDYYNLKDEDNIESTNYYEYDKNNRLIKYRYKYTVEDYDREVYEAIYDNSSVTYKIARYSSKDVINYGFKEYRELDKYGRITNSIYYKNVESDTPSYQYLYTYSKENGYDVVVEIYKTYDSETNTFVNVSRDTTKTKGNKTIVLADEFMSEINDFVLSEIVTKENKNGVECENTEYYDYDTTTYEPFIRTANYTEKFNEYNMRQQVYYNDGVITSGRKEVNDKNYSEIYFYNTKIKDFSIESKNEILDSNVARETQYTYVDDVLSTKIETTKKSVTSQELTTKVLRIAYYEDGSEKIKEVQEYEYDDNNNVTGDFFERYENGVLLKKETREKTFTDFNKTSTSVEKKYDKDGLYYTQNIVWTYDDDERCISSCYETIEKEKPYSKELYEFEYDGSTKLYETTTRFDENNNITYSMKYLYTNYTVVFEKVLINGELKMVFESVLNDNYEVEYDVTYEYDDENGILVDSITTYYENDEIKAKIEHYYDENGSIIKIDEYYHINGFDKLAQEYELIDSSSLFEGQLKLTKKYTYDANGYVKTEELYTYFENYIRLQVTTKSGSTTTNKYKEFNYYDSNLNLILIEEYGHYSSAGDCWKTAEYRIIDGKMELIASYEYYTDSEILKNHKVSSLKDSLGLAYLIELTYDTEGNITSNTIYVNDLENNYYYTYHIKDELLSSSNDSTLYNYYINGTLDTNCTLEEDTTVGTMTINGIINND